MPLNGAANKNNANNDALRAAQSDATSPENETLNNVIMSHIEFSEFEKARIIVDARGERTGQHLTRVLAFMRRAGDNILGN